MSFFFHLLTSQDSGISQPWLFLNAGQSNDEKGQLLTNVDLTAPYQVPFPEVQYWGADNAWHTLDYSDQDSYQAPLNGVTLNYANQFYLYPQLAAALGRTAQEPLYVCSYSVGDTSLEEDWKADGTGALYDAMVLRIQAVIADLTLTYGVAPRIFCFLFDQGEKDGRSSPFSSAYSANFTLLKNNLRTITGDSTLKFYCPLVNSASINGSPNPVQLGAVVNDAKRNTGDPLVKTQDTNYFEPATDGVHFTAAGQLAKNNGQIQDFINHGWLEGTPIVPPAGYKYFNGYNTYMWFPTGFNTTFSAVDAVFRLGISIWNPPAYSTRTLVSQFNATGNQRAFHWYLLGTTIQFNWYRTGAGGDVRGVTWTGLNVLYDGNPHKLEIRYNGALDTNNGLDRPDLYIDDVLYTTGKALTANGGTLGNIFAATSRVGIARLVAADTTPASTLFPGGGWFANFFVKSGAGPTTVVDVPNIATGTDNSGNGYNGTLVNG